MDEIPLDQSTMHIDSCQCLLYSLQNCPIYQHHRVYEFGHIGPCMRWCSAVANLEFPTIHFDLRQCLELNRDKSTLYNMTIWSMRWFQLIFSILGIKPDGIAAHQRSVWSSAVLFPNPINESNLKIAKLISSSQADVHSKLV